MEKDRNSILIVDDEGPNIAVLGRLLGDEYTVYAAIDGPTSLNMAKKHRPDLILLDIIMPEMNGYAVLSKLKAMPETKEIPVIFITGLSGKQDEKKGLALDAADYIAKPFNEVTVKLRVRNQIQIVNAKRTIEHLTEAAEESSKSKSRFLARMSHEIRTPITAVLGVSEIQLRNQVLPPQTEEAFAKVYDSSKTLLNIVNDILDFSKIESGKMPLINNVYDVASLVSDAAQLHLVYLENKEVAFKMYVDETLPSKLIGDSLRIRQIINNLLTNAFKYTQAGEVSLDLYCKDMETKSEKYIELVISIRDTGIGMSEEQIEELNAINSEYVRFHEQEKHSVGTGLGLPIVYSLVQMMNAQIDLKSRQGEGSHIIIRIPQKVSGKEILGRELANSLQNFEVGTWMSEKELEFKPEPMPYGKVLVVDDVDSNLYVAEAMLDAFKLNIELCESGQEALDKVREGNVYDIIFMDHMMPGMDGIEVTKTLRDKGYDHPIVALTANAVKGQAELFMESGFSGFMSKPIDINRLNSYLVRFVKDRHMELNDSAVEGYNLPCQVT